jgi:hypothetical protein
MEIIHNKKMKLNVPKFLCDDNPVGEHLNDYPMLKHLNSYGFTGIIGKPGSGKTSLLISMLTGKGQNKVFRKCFNHLLLVMPTSSRQSMSNNIFEKHSPDKMFDELDYATTEKIYERLLDATEKDENTLLVLDDVGASLKNKDIQKLLRLIIYNRRHLKVHIVILIQSFLSLAKEVRKLLTNIIMFKPSKVEFENLMDECFEIKKDKALELMTFVYKKPHQYLFLNIEQQKMYTDFDEIILEE